MSELKSLVNIGPELDAQLNDVGIVTVDDLRRIGSREAWLRIQAIDDSACIHTLFALEGAIQAKRWHSLSNEVRAELKLFVQQFS